MNFKKTTSLVLVILFIVSVVPFAAFAEGTDGIMFGYNSTLGGAVVVGYDGTDPDVVIPATDASGSPVIGIANQAFGGNSNIKSITMPDSVTYLEERAILNCDNLETVVFSENLETIGEYNFWYTGSLKSIDLPATLESIGRCSFVGCGALESITVDSQNSVFSSVNGCLIKTDNANQTITVVVGIGSESVVIPQNVTHIGEYAFYEKSGIVEVSFPSSLVNIGDYAFQKCTSLKSVSATASIGSQAFGGCTSLESLSILNGADTISTEAFSGCSALANVAISSTVSEIETGAFKKCVNIEELVVSTDNSYYIEDNGNLIEIRTGKLIACKPDTTVSERVRVVGEYAFYGHLNTHVSLPGSVEKIEQYAFYGMENLKEIRMVNVKNIGYRAFYMNEELETVILGVALEEIGAEAFGNCPFIKSYTLPNTLKKIGEKAFFYNSMSITEIFIPVSVTEIGSNAFQGNTVDDIYCEAESQPDSWASDWLGNCNATVHWGVKNTVADGFVFEPTAEGDGYIVTAYLGKEKDVTIPRYYNTLPVVAIADRAFMFCETIETVEIVDSIVSIGDVAFMQCTALKSINIPASVTHIGSNPFVFCPNLKSMTVDLVNQTYHSYKNGMIIDTDKKTIIAGVSTNIPTDGSVTKIANEAFRGASVTNAWLPAQIEYVGDYAFSDCDSLGSQSFSNPDTVLGIHVFEGCDNLGTASLPQNIKKVPIYTFSFCPSITSCNLPNGVTEIGEGAFYACNSFTGGFLYNTQLTTIGDVAFAYCPAYKNFTVDVNLEHIGNGAFMGTPLAKINNYENENFFVDGNCLIDAKTLTIVAAMADLTEFSDPFRIRGIGWGVFVGRDFYEYNITEYVADIGDYAFQNCSNITSIAIPESVTTMGTWVFNDCHSLKDIYVEVDAKPSGWDDEWLGNCKATVHWGYSVEMAEANSLITELKSLNREDFRDEEWNAIQSVLAEYEGVDFAELTETELNEIISKLKIAKLKNPKISEFGDLDGDNKVGSSDYLFTKRSCFGSFQLDALQIARADINKDSKVDSADYVSIKRVAFGTFKIG